MDDELGKWGQQRMSSQNFPSNKTERCKEPDVSKPTPEPGSDYKNSAVVEIPCMQSAMSAPLSSPTNVLIWGTVAKQPVKLLVDTGAAVSVVSENFYESILRASHSLLHKGTIDSVKTANGHVVFVRGFVSFPVFIGKKEYQCDASVVPGLSYDVVLGRDFLHQFSAVIDVKGCFVTFDEINTVYFAVGDVPPFVSEVKVSETHVIDAQSEVIIPVSLATFSSQPVIGLLDATSKLSDRYHLLGASSLSRSSEDGFVSFRLLNPSDEPVLLHKGTVVGQFEEMHPDDVVVSLESKPFIASIDAIKCQEKKDLLSSFDCLPSPALTFSENSQLNGLLEAYGDIFASSSLDLGHTSIIQHEIDTGNSKPIKQAPYRVSQNQRDEIESHISKMLEQNIISVSSSPWSSPVVLVKKKDGTTRFCIDYRKLNAVTRKDSFPLPRIDDALDSLAGSNYFTTLDLQSGYHQVAMHPSSKEKTAFISHAGLYEFNVMSFGLTNAPPNFQRLMSRLLHGLEWKICLIYIDDIIVFSKTFEEHLSRLSLVFDRLREASLKLKPKKCFFARSSVNFLGFLVSSSGVSPDPEKLESVRSFPTPTSVKGVQSFLGLCNYYRRFVEGFAKIASPLNHLTRKNVVFEWSSDCEAAFQILKSRLCSPPILAYPDFSQPFHLYTDASQSALGYILGQVVDGKEHVIAYGGRELSLQETRYSTTEREALAVIDGIKRYQPYLFGRKFFVHTDHGSLSWLMKVKDPTGRLARWALQLQQYDFDVLHRPGSSNGNADALSRRPYTSSKSPVSTSPSVVVIDNVISSVQRLHTLQRQDADLSVIIQYLEESQLPLDNSQARSLLLSIDSYYLDENGILFHLWSPGKRRVTSIRSQVVIPASLRYDVLVSCHDDPTAGHFGVLKTYEKIRARYYWHGMFKDIEHWCNTCVDCAMKKMPRNKHKAPLLPIPVDGAFDRVAMDILGPFPVTNSGNRYIIVFSDYYTRWPEAFALPSTEASRIAWLLVNEILARHGSPRTLLSDRGANFLSAVVKEVSHLLNTKRLHTTSYHPQTDGLVERFNGTLAESLSMYVSTNQKDWDEHLPLILFAYRVSPSATTHESPFYLLYGREPRLPLDTSLLISASNLSSSVEELRSRVVENLERAQRIIKSNTQLAQQRMKFQYDKTSRPVRYEIGSKVWVYTPKTRKGYSKKLTHNFHGPYRIVAKLSPVHFKLHNLDNRPVSVPVHANRLKPYYDPADRPICPPDADPETPDLTDADLPSESFEDENHKSQQVQADSITDVPITRPEDVHTPDEIIGI